MTTPTDPTRPTGYPSDTTFGAGGPAAVPGDEATGGTQSGSLKDAGRETASTAKDEARKVASTAGDQVHERFRGDRVETGDRQDRARLHGQLADAQRPQPLVVLDQATDLEQRAHAPSAPAAPEP